MNTPKTERKRHRPTTREAEIMKVDHARELADIRRAYGRYSLALIVAIPCAFAVGMVVGHFL